MGPPRPGEVLPAMVRDRLELTADQANQVDALQKEVDARLEKILNEDQKARLQEMRSRGPGGSRRDPRPGAGPVDSDPRRPAAPTATARPRPIGRNEPQPSSERM
jgi:hypothetical protein